MAKINTKSIGFKTFVTYIIMTVFNVTIFNAMVFFNQTGLIVENAKLTSQHTGTSLKYRIDQIGAGEAALDTVAINRILREAAALGIRDLSLYSENGKVFVEVRDNKPAFREQATVDELRMINKAITGRDFEEKAFYHQVNKRAKTIELFIPFTFEGDKIGVAQVILGMKDIDKAMGLLYRQCIVIAVLVILVHLVFAWFVSKMILRPLQELNEATREIAQGKLDIRVPIVRDDEIGRLASSFNEMSVALQRIRDEAKGANPLTGLPGNLTIARYIDDSLSGGKIIAVLYCDLDNFKAYNDKYGFTKGDEAILYSRDCLSAVAKRKDMKEIFVGHEGGDDFVVICPYEFWEPFAKAFITTFDRGIYQFYNSIDARNGFIESVNRRGERQRFPLMSVSIAIVTNKTRPFRRHAEMIQVAAEVKKYVKSIEGSCYAIDRRQGPVGQGPAAQGSTAQGSTAQGSTTQGSTTQGPATQGPMAPGSAGQAPAGPGQHPPGLASPEQAPPGQGPLTRGPAPAGPAAPQRPAQGAPVPGPAAQPGPARTAQRGSGPAQQPPPRA